MRASIVLALVAVLSAALCVSAQSAPAYPPTSDQSGSNGMCLLGGLTLSGGSLGSSFDMSTFVYNSCSISGSSLTLQASFYDPSSHADVYFNGAQMAADANGNALTPSSGSITFSNVLSGQNNRIQLMVNCAEMDQDGQNVCQYQYVLNCAGPAAAAAPSSGASTSSAPASSSSTSSTPSSGASTTSAPASSSSTSSAPSSGASTTSGSSSSSPSSSMPASSGSSSMPSSGMPSSGASTTSAPGSSTPTPSSGASSYVVGDPQFIGLRGQNFQVHGVSGEVYNIVSDADLQFNSRFVFLDQGKCPVVNGKKQKGCWSHPGSYLGELGLKTKSGDMIHMETGPHNVGFGLVEVNGKAMQAGETVMLADDMGFVSLNTTHLATVQIGNWDFAFENSDMFVNQRVRVLDSRNLRSHGLLGQTWRDTTYPNQIKYVQGQVDDYVIRDDNDIFGDNFLYNQFN